MSMNFLRIIVSSTLLVSFSGNADPRPVPKDAPTCFIEAYPDIVCGFEGNALRLCNGAVLPWDDGLTKTHQMKLETADLEDTVSQAYPLGPIHHALPIDYEPGRMRNKAFLDAVYGQDPSQVKPRLQAVSWPGSSRKLRVTTVGGAAEKLAAVAQAVAALPAAIRRTVAQVGGGYNARVISGTTRKSAHSYGIAVDVAMGRAEYWRWRLGPNGQPRPMRGGVPQELVELFEHHGFIWGGKWYRYDTMHFEYRPELIHPACACGAANTCYP